MSAASLLGEAPATVAIAAPVSTATDTGGALPAAAAAVATPVATVAPTWHDAISNPTVKEYVVGKGWKDPGEIAEQYQHLEKLLGGEKIPMPKGEQDTEGWNRLYKAVGRPETPDGYKLAVPEGVDPSFSKDAATWFHQAGLSNKQAQMLAKQYNEYGAKIQQAQQAQIDARNLKELDEYKAEMGAAYDAKLEMGKRAAKQFGFSNDELVAFERTFGTKALLTRFAAIGEGLGEHVVVGQNKAPVTATSAAARLAELKKDPEFVAKYTSGNADAMREMKALNAAAVGMTLEEYEATLGTPTARRRA